MTQIDLEDYREVVGYPEYLINEYGIVWDKRQSKHLSWIKNNDFNCVNMCAQGGKKELVKIHHAVAKAFLTKPENATKIVMHVDLNRDNNHYSNLAWKIKGVSHQAFLRYSNYHGVKYHLTELEEISEKSGLPLYTVRNRLEAGYTVEEIYQGYKHSDVYCVDGIKFIGEVEVKKYLDMLDRDTRRKERESLKCEIRHRMFTEELERLQREKELREKVEKRGTTDPKVVKEARSTWKGMMDRCYSPNRFPETYNRYGGKGVTVCDEWQDVDVFIGWYIEHHIEGWDIEKDLIPLYEGRLEKQYSPDNCCFVPKAINQWVARTSSVPKILVNSCGYYLVIRNKVDTFVRPSIRLTASNEKELTEQWYLYKDLHFEKRVWEMKEEHKKLCSKYPNTPQISPRLLSILDRFSTEEYLRLRNT